jgi:hypothetical protein
MKCFLINILQGFLIFAVIILALKIEDWWINR